MLARYPISLAVVDFRMLIKATRPTSPTIARMMVGQAHFDFPNRRQFIPAKIPAAPNPKKIARAINQVLGFQGSLRVGRGSGICDSADESAIFPSVIFSPIP